MASIFNSLNIGYTGLNASQVGINTAGHNITNAETEGYTRQRVAYAQATPMSSSLGNVGMGVEIQDIKRVFDNFVFERYSSISADKEYSDYEQKNLEQLSTYFPEIDGVGVKSELAEFYNAWQTFSDNPDNDSVKVALAKQTELLSKHIAKTQDQVTTLQGQINEDIVVSVNEVNSIAEQIAQLNKEINVAEQATTYSANDLRDQRNILERNLARLIGAEVHTGTLSSSISTDSSSNTRDGSYSISVGGFNIVDGSTYHPIHTNKDNNPNGYYEVSFERQDGKLIAMENEISGGKIGAMLDLRGGSIDSTSGYPVDGTIQNTISQLDAFAQGLIESTNNLYASSPTTSMQSNILDMNETGTLLDSPLNIKEGSFNLVVYDLDGNVAASREITINNTTVMRGSAGSNSIEGQIFAEIDDNANMNANDDIDNYFKNGFNFKPSESGELRLELNLDGLAQAQGYTFAIEDNLTTEGFSSGTNFAGALGMSRFFDGDDAQSIRLNTSYSENPTLLSAGSNPAAGDNTLALNMVQHQFETFDYHIGERTFETTSYGMFDILATEVGTATNSAIMRNDTITAQYNITELEYFSVSKVSVDEEMTNLIKFQTSYGAAAKLITTIDQMMQTLLGIKQ
jgi:flagellar hook-associated protein 1 FlgK